jgi:hypothetical protein
VQRINQRSSRCSRAAAWRYDGSGGQRPRYPQEPAATLTTSLVSSASHCRLISKASGARYAPTRSPLGGHPSAEPDRG